jgi:hypothetical protein
MIAQKRIAIADILKGIAVVRMVLVHLIDVFAIEAISTNPVVKLMLFLVGPPGAALFMVIMGYFIAKSANPFSISCRRGLKLIWWGLLLNIGLNLNLLVSIFMGKSDINPWPYIFGVDILFLAGISLIILALFKKLSLIKPIYLVILILVSVTLGSLLPVYQGGHLWINYLLAFAYGNVSWAYFPLLPWLAYPVAGSLFYLLEQRFGFSSFTPKGLIYLAVAHFVIIAITFSFGFKVVQLYKAYYNHGLAFALWMIAMVSFWAIVIRLISLNYEQLAFFRWFGWVGRRVTNFYVIQWLLIGNIGTEVYKSQHAWQLVIWFFLIISLTSLLTYLWQHRYKLRY